MGVAVDVGIERLETEHTLAQRLVALLDGTTEGWVLQQPLPKGWCGAVAGALKAPRLEIVGVGEVAVAVGQVVVPHGTCHELAAAAVGVLLFLVEIGTALVAVSIDTEFGVDEVIDKRRYVDVARIACCGIGKVGRLYDLLDSIYIALYVGHLLGLQILFLGIDARPDDLAGHDAVAYAGDF